MERHWDTASKHEHSASADEAVLALRQSFCDHLVSARKRRGLSILEIASITRIPVRSLERLESGLFEELPADVFVRGFLRSYARCVGLDAEETIRRYTACGMPAAPVASPMADQLASTMATLHEGGHPSVRQVTAPLPSQAMSEDGIGTSPGPQTLSGAFAAGRMSRPATSASADQALIETTPVPAALPAAGAHAKPLHGEDAPSEDVWARVQVSVAVQSLASISGAASSHEEQPSEERPARRKRRRRRRQRREVADAASSVTSATPETQDAQVDSTSSSLGASEALEIAGQASVHVPVVETVADASGDLSMPAVEVVASKTSTLQDESTSSAISQVAQASRAATAAERVPATLIGRPFTALPRASTQSARTQPTGRGRAPTVTARPVLVIDDAHPEEAERAQEERVERSDSSWRSLLPPSLLDSDDGSHRGTLTLAVIILVIVATLTMSYLLRRPNISGDGVTWNTATEPGEQRLAS